MGKWSKFKGKFGSVPEQGNKEYLQKLDQIRSKAATLDLDKLCSEYRKAKEQKKKVLELLSKTNTEVEGLSRVIVEIMEARQLQTFTYAGGGTFYLRIEPYPSIENKDTLRAWVEDGNQYLLGVIHQTLAAVVKENLLKGEDPPPGVKVYLKTTVGYRK